MKNYIDAEKVKAHIQYLIKKDHYELFDVPELLSFIDSLQQEQPKVDLEKEIETYFKGWYMDETDQGYILHTPDDHAGLMSVKQVARHFYELGLKAKEG